MKNIMVFSCGSLIAIDINISLRGNNEYKVYGASSYDDHGMYVYENYIGSVPFIYEHDFIPRFNEILDNYKIDFIIPTHDTMIVFLQEHANEIHATVVSSCYETALLCRYKSKTYSALKGYDFIPKTYQTDEVMEFPVFVKKDDDQGARNAYKVETVEQLNLYGRHKDMIICEYLPGEEVTVDCFTDRHGELRFCNPRITHRMMAGIDVNSKRMQYNKEILGIAENLNKSISFHGPWFFQIKKAVDGKYKLLEIATRFAGAFSLSRCMDINLPLIVLRDFDGKEVDISYNNLMINADKMLISRYAIPYEYDTVYLDGIDVFKREGMVDTYFMMFVYQCMNKGKKLVMLTHDSKEIKRAVSEMKLSEKLFDPIIDHQTYDELDYTNSIFVSKNEALRNRLRREFQTICMEPAAIEGLIDWRA